MSRRYFFCLLHPEYLAFGSVSYEPCQTTLSSYLFLLTGRNPHFRFGVPANRLASTFLPPWSGDFIWATICHPSQVTEYRQVAPIYHHALTVILWGLATVNSNERIAVIPLPSSQWDITWHYCLIFLMHCCRWCSTVCMYLDLEVRQKLSAYRNSSIPGFRHLVMLIFRLKRVTDSLRDSFFLIMNVWQSWTYLDMEFPVRKVLDEIGQSTLHPQVCVGLSLYHISKQSCMPFLSKKILWDVVFEYLPL